MSYRRQHKKRAVYTVQVISPKGHIVTWLSPGAVEGLALDWSLDPLKDYYSFIGIDKSGYSVGQWTMADVRAGWFAKDVL